MRKNTAIVAALSALVMPLALGACGSQAPDEDATEEVDVPVAADAPEGVALTQAQVRLPAASGRPGVAYFVISSEEPRKIVNVSVMGAGRSEIHETNMANGTMTMAQAEEVLLQPGEQLAFQPGGYHVMLFDIDATLVAGGTTDLTITFENGDKASIEAGVTGPGGMSGNTMDGDMAGMDH